MALHRDKGDAMLFATRRKVLGATALTALALPAISRAQGKEPVRIGSALPLTGSQAGYGRDFDTSMRMAAKDVNDAGGIVG
jgi:branched-chain amino acid transport system substrate-binding protein